jgi:predicted transcriptional regulator
MDIYEDVQHAIDESGATNAWLSRQTGLAYNTIRSIRRGEANPTAGTLEKIINAILEPHGDKSCENCKHCEFIERHLSGGVEVFCIIAMGTKFDDLSCAAFAEDDHGAT